MIKTRLINNKKTWEKFVLNNPQASFLQSWNWGKMNKNLGFKVFRLGFFKQKKLLGVSLLIKKKAKRATFLECPAGPLILWHQPQLFLAFVNKIKEIGLLEKCQFVRVRPPIIDSLTNRIKFKNAGFIPSPMHLHAETTWQLSLDKSEEGLLRQMRKTTRYLIKKGQKMGVKIEKSRQLKDIDILVKLQQETVLRHHFVPFPKSYFWEEFKAFVSDNQALLFKAKARGKILAIAIIVFYAKEAVYHYSGSSSSFPKIPASYLLQWEAIKEAKKRKCKIYNFWGINPTDNPKHRFAGVSLFKKGFGGFRLDFLHAHDLPLSLSYWLVYAFEFLRKIHRHL